MGSDLGIPLSRHREIQLYTTLFASLPGQHGHLTDVSFPALRLEAPHTLALCTSPDIPSSGYIGEQTLS